MGKFLKELRTSAMSVRIEWWYAYLAVFFIQTTGWILMVAWDEAIYGEHVRVIEYLRAVGRDSSHMVQIFILIAIGVVEIGRLAVVLAENLAKRLKQRREQDRQEFIAKIMKKGRAEGEAEGITQLASKVAAWNERRLEAEARGEKFDEPPPMK